MIGAGVGVLVGAGVDASHWGIRLCFCPICRFLHSSFICLGNLPLPTDFCRDAFDLPEIF